MSCKAETLTMTMTHNKPTSQHLAYRQLFIGTQLSTAM